MINGGAVYTDESGNVPELSTMMHFVEDLTTRLNKNRGNLDDISALAKKVISHQVASIQQLETTLRKHVSYDEDNEQQANEEDDDIQELEQHEFEDSKEGDNDLRRSGSTRSSGVSSIPDRQAREIERRRKRNTPALAADDASPLRGDSWQTTLQQQELQQQKKQSNITATRHARIAQENLDLKVELQRLQSIESKLTDLVTQFQYKTGEVCDISKKYMRDYKTASRKLTVSYETQLDLERRNQQHLECARVQYLHRLDEVKTSMENAGAFIASDLQQKLDMVYSPDTIVKYTLGHSPTSSSSLV